MFECSDTSNSVVGALAQLDAALGAVGAIDPRLLDREEIGALTIEMHSRQSCMDAQVTRITGAFDTFGDPEGALGTPAWVAWKCRIKKSQAKAEVSRARALRHMPEVAAAYAAGEISTEHVRLLAAGYRSNGEAFAKAEEELVDAAKTLRFDAFAYRVAYFRQLADPDGTEEEAQDAFERRHLHCSRTFEGTVQLDGLFDPIGGTIYKNELDRIERKLFEADWTEARDRLGDNARADDLQRTSEQRRLDAQVEMARRSAAMPAGSTFNRPLITVLVGYETLFGRICQLADGTVVTPGQADNLFTEADFERVVFDGPSRVVDVGVKQRLFKGATRRAVEVRDQFCTHDSCDVPYERCDVDHIQRWEHDGPTTEDNGRLRCPGHHPGRRRRP